MHHITIAKHVYTRSEMRESGLYSKNSEKVFVLEHENTGLLSVMKFMLRKRNAH
jgi:hypothetical protein